jgi:hypothetical integral membrane protein (TIGR02206 family)
MVVAVESPPAYWSAVALALAGCLATSLAARRWPGTWRTTVARLIGLALAADVITYSVQQSTNGSWTATTDLPLALCDVAALVAALACWWPVALLVELTYFWGGAGTLQAVITPDLGVGFPHLVFFEYLVGHLGIVCAALFLVVGLGLSPRPGSVPRVFGLTALYAAFVGLVDALSDANYMFLRRPPGEWTVLRLLGPWPWYTVSAAGVALLLVLLDWPFWKARRAGVARRPVTRPASG